MGALFLLAGYFTPGSYERKGPARFLKAKLLRLGIPSVIFCFTLNPISELAGYLMPASITGITGGPSWQEYPTLIGLGPVWFVVMLLIFSGGYATWRWLTRRRSTSWITKLAKLSYLGIAIFTISLVAITYVTRMLIPLGKSILDFPTLAYLPQYLSFFVLGTIAFRLNWFKTLSGLMGVVGFAIATAAIIFLFPLAFSGSVFSLRLAPELNNAMGNGHWQSAVYAAWDSLFSVGMCLGLVALFRRFFASQGRFGRFAAQHSYTVYLIHVPVVIYLGYALRELELMTLLKFAIVAAVIVPICFAVAYALRKIPGLSRIL